MLHNASFFTLEPTSPASPSIVKEIEDCAVAEGEAATFTCYISGHPLSDIKWYKEDELLVEGKAIDLFIIYPCFLSSVVFQLENPVVFILLKYLSRC